jgi:hypothetical protein
MFKKYNMKNIILFILILLICGCSKQPIEISQIDVLGNKNSIIKSLSFNEINFVKSKFKNMNNVSAPKGIYWPYKLKISSEKFGGLWLYNQHGYIAKLNKAFHPCYKFRDVDELNKIFGIENTANP